jgi:hypothetical protein
VDSLQGLSLFFSVLFLFVLFFIIFLFLYICSHKKQTCNFAYAVKLLNNFSLLRTKMLTQLMDFTLVLKMVSFILSLWLFLVLIHV